MKSYFPDPGESVFILKTLFYRLPFYTWLLKRSARDLNFPQHLPPSLIKGNPLTGEALMDGYFEFDGEKQEIQTRNWYIPKASKNWHRHLHEFTWLHDLKSLNKEETRTVTKAIVLDWCRQHSSLYKQNMQASVVMAMRVTNWICLFDFISSKMLPEQKRIFMASMWIQIRYLYAAFPLDATGADRIRITKALFNAELVFPENKIIRKAKKKPGHLSEGTFVSLNLLEQELRKQILTDGGLIERSAGRNLQALNDLIEIRASLRHFSLPVRPILDLAIRLLSNLIEALKLPDGKLAHHHNVPALQIPDKISVFSGTEAKTQVTGSSFPAGLSFPDSGFERFEAKRSILLVNTYGCSPEQIENKYANSFIHAAPMAFEFALGRQRIVVNCGSHPDQRRFGKIERSTAAHSTLQLADINALKIAPILATGRLAARAYKGVKKQQGFVQVDRNIEANTQSIFMSHTLYETKGGGTFQRQIQLEADGELIQGRDQVHGCEHPFVLVRFHLHPDVLPRQNELMAVLRMPTGRPWHFDISGHQPPTLTCGKLLLADSVYFENGQIRKTKQIVIQIPVKAGSASLEWVLSREGRAYRRDLS